MCLNTIFSNERGVRLTKANRISGHRPLITAGYENNGVATYISNPEQKIFSKNVITIDMFGNTFFRNYEFSADDNILVLTSLIGDIPNSAQIYIASSINKAIAEKYSYGKQFRQMSFNETLITLPIYDNGKIAFDYMTDYIKELEAERIKELEAERIKELEAYLFATGLNDYVLTDEEKKLIEDFKNGTVPWRTFKVDELFEKSTRGKRLKSLDRTNGDLPFVTAGEINNGISAFIGNEVFKFKKNTTTIDMFGSAKYRNYQYGCDDHITVVHTEQLDKHSAIFVTSALDKAAHTGDFDYSRNFYAKDADNLFIKLPVTDNGTPDYKKMSIYLRAIEKLVIKGVVEWENKKIATTAKIVNEHTS